MGANSTNIQDYVINYNESTIQGGTANSRKIWDKTSKKIRVQLFQNKIEVIPIQNSLLTVGWLLSEVFRRYNEHFSNNIKPAA